MKLFGNDGGSHSAPKHNTEIETTEIRSEDFNAQVSEQPKKNGRRRALIALCAVVLAVAVLLIVYALWERPPEVAAPTEVVITLPPATESPDSPDETAAPEATPAETPDPGEAPAVALGGDRKDGVYTFLLVGRDYASNSTDTIIVGSFDTQAHRIACVSIPRDTLINIKWASTPKKINAVYPGYINSGENGIDGLRSQIKNLLGFDVDCYAVVTLDAVVQAVDAIGGVWFDVPVDMFYGDPLQDLSICINKGYQLLDGENALKLCRFRYTYAGGDLDRISVQQDFLKAAASQMLSLGNIPNLGTLIDILQANLDTNMSAANMAWFARQFLGCDMEDITFETLPYSCAAALNGVSFVSINTESWLSLINEKLNPYETEVTAANINILTCNAAGTSVSATNGTVAGGEDSFYCLTCTVNNGGKVVYHAPGACPTGEAEAPTETEEETPAGEAPSEEAPTEENPTVEVVIPSAEPGTAEETQSAE